MPFSGKILVAIPCYRCERQIPRVLAGFSARTLDRVAKVILIDNRSPDGTVEAAVQAIRDLGSDKFEVLRNDRNYGLGGTHKVAFLFAEKMGADYVAILHGDAQARTEELNLLIDEAAECPEAAAVLGARFMRRSRLQGYSRVRKWGNIGLNLLYSVFSLRATFDLGSGLNLFRVRDLLDHRYLGFSDGFTFNMDSILEYYRKKAPLRFVPITWSEEDQVSNAKTFSVGWITLKTLLRWRAGLPARIPAEASGYTYAVVHP